MFLSYNEIVYKNCCTNLFAEQIVKTKLHQLNDIFFFCKVYESIFEPTIVSS